LAGITRLADVTSLDWVGLPVYQAIRPNSRNISVSQGKGLTRSLAKVSALMEALESFHAEAIQQPGVRATLGSMRRELDYDPFALPVVAARPRELRRDLGDDPYAPSLGTPSLVRDQTPVDWVPACDLLTGKPTWVPRQLCELNFSVDERLCPPLFRATSNGLASGSTPAEAVVHGLCEVIERDSLWRMQATPVRELDSATVRSPLVHGLLERFSSAGLSARMLDATGPSGVPCFVVFLGSAESRARYYGAGCHPRPLIALLRALLEAAQSRLGHIAGSRDDLYRRSYIGAPESSHEAAPSLAEKMTTNLSNGVRMATWGDTVRDLAQRIRRQTGMAPVVVDLARPAFELPVVFVVAPGLRLIPPRRQ
jgi:ribosomal protein S12 methylthiotransferase accessory factor